MQFGEDGIKEESIFVCASVRKSYQHLMDIYDKDGKARFVTISPVFSNILRSVRDRGKEPTCVPMLDTDEGWQLDLDALGKTLQPGDVLILTNPNNPNGYVYTQEDLRKIITLCKRHGVKIISDDIWSDQIHCPGKRHVPIMNVAMQEEYEDNVAMLYSTGKAFNTSLIPCAAAIIPNAETRRDLVQKVRGDNPSELGARLAIDTINSDGNNYMNDLNTRLRQNAEYAASVFREMGCRVHPSESTSVMFLKLNEMVVQVGFQPKIKRAIPDLMQELNIGYSEGQNFGLPGYIRINIGVPCDILKSRLNKLKNRWNAQLQNS